RSSKLKLEYLLILSSDLFVLGLNALGSKSIQNSASIGVVVIQKVTGGVLDGVLSSRRVGSHIITHTLNGALGLAAAGCKLRSKAVEARLILIAEVADSRVNAVEAVGQAIVQRVSAIADALLDGGNTALKVIQCKALID